MIWRDMETSPKDGTKIWGFNNPSTFKPKIVVMCFRDRAGQKRWMTDDSRPVSNPILWQPLSDSKPPFPAGYLEEEATKINPPWYFGNKWQARKPETPEEWADWIWGPSGENYKWEQIFLMITTQAIEKERLSYNGALTIPRS